MCMRQVPSLFFPLRSAEPGFHHRADLFEVRRPATCRGTDQQAQLFYIESGNAAFKIAVRSAGL